MELRNLLKAKSRYIALGLLFVLLAGNKAYAAEDFSWSETEPPLEICTRKNSKDDTTGNIGFVIDGERVAMELPDCETAMKTRVLVVINGKYLHTVAGTGAEPFIENGRTMIPLRAIADAFAFEVEWEGTEQKVTLTKGRKTITMHIGKSEILVDGETIYFEGAVPMIKNSRTFLPASKLAEILGIQVEWDGDARTATFTSE